MNGKREHWTGNKLNFMDKKIDQVPEEFKKLADDFSKNGFITTSFDNLINWLSLIHI